MIQAIKRFFLSLFFMGLMTVLVAQTPEQTMRIVENNRMEYYVGHGYADGYEQAVQRAKAQLVEDIAIYVQSHTTGTVSTETGISMEERIHTYTNMTQLRDVETVLISEHPTSHVFCYVKKSVVQQMFEERKQKMRSYFDEARRAEKNLMMAEGLRYYYWSLLVLKTLPEGSRETFIDEEGHLQNMLLWLNDHISEILNNIEFQPIAISNIGECTTLTGVHELKQLEISVTYHGKPVSNCEYQYWTGRGYSQPVRAKDGRGIAEFCGDVPQQLRFRVEYVFESDARNIDPELRDIVAMEGRPTWNENVRMAALETSSASPAALEPHPIHVDKMPETFSGCEFVQQLSEALDDSCTHVMEVVKNAVVSKNYTVVRPLCTTEGWQMFNMMMKDGNATILGDSEWKFIRVRDEILCRGLSVSLKYPRSGKTIVENVEFRLDYKTLKINSLSYTLNQEAESDILNEEKKWETNSRFQLMRFLQDYQTAYALKRADFLESIFSEDALIIVGVELKRAPNLENRILPTNQKQYKFTQKSKSEYIDHLRRIFASAEFVNLQLKDNEILKVPNKEIYGIQIRQIYTSSSYADQGYLFLVVDLRDAEHPIIHVRTWQPDKDPDFGFFDLGKFTIN